MLKSTLLIMIFLISVNFAHYFFESYTNAEINANQIPSYIIDFNSSKSFVRELDNLHVKTYYGFPF